MRGQRSYVAAIAAWGAWLALMAAPASGQVQITSIQASLPEGPILNANGITSGMVPPPDGIILYINGNFPNAAVGSTVTWYNTVTAVSFTNPQVGGSTTQ